MSIAPFPRFTPSCALAILPQAGIPAEGPWLIARSRVSEAMEDALPAVLPRYVALGKFTDEDVVAYEARATPSPFMLRVITGGLESAGATYLGYIDLFEDRFVPAAEGDSQD